MRRRLAWLGGLVAALVVAVAAAGLALPWVVGTARVQAMIASAGAQALGRPVSFASAALSVFPRPTIVVRDVEVPDDPTFGPTPVLRLERADVRLALWPLLGLRIEPREVVLRRPDISVVQRADGRWNVATLGARAEARGGGRPRAGGGPTAPGAAPLGAHTTIEDGTLRLHAARHGRQTDLRLEQVRLEVLGRAGGAGFHASARLVPGDLALSVTEGALTVQGSRSLEDVSLRARLTVEGREVAELARALAGPEPALSGNVRGALTVSGTLRRPRAEGEVALERVGITRAVPGCGEPRRRTLAVDSLRLGLSWDGASLAAHPLTARVAGGTVTARVALDVGGGGGLTVDDLSARGVAAEEVLAGVACGRYAVSGPADLAGSASLGLADPLGTLRGQGRLRVGPGRVTGPQALALLGGALRVLTVATGRLSDVPATVGTSPLAYDAITGTFTVAGGLLSTRDLAYDSRTLRARTAGTYALATGALNLDVTAQQGPVEIHARVTGAVESPRVRMATPSALREIDPAAARQGLRELLRRFR